MLQRLVSRKFWCTAGVFLSGLLGVDPTRLAIIGVVVGIYVLIEGLIDKARAEAVAAAVEEGLAIGRKLTSSEGADAS